MTSNNKKLGIIYCSLLALQFGLQPLISTHFTAKGISKSSIVIATEIGKILISCIALSREPHSVREKIWLSWNFKSSLTIAAIPASLYAIQNLLVQYGYTLIDSMTFNLLNQTKTLSAAFFLWIFLDQGQSYMQIFALFLLLAAAVVLNIKISEILSLNDLWDKIFHVSNSDAPSNYQLGLFCVLSASLLSGISAALVQRAFTLPNARNPLVLSTELAVYGIFVLLVKDFLLEKNLQLGGVLVLLNNWDLYSLIPVISNACGGLVVGFVSKYAGGVIKGFALIAGLLITGVAQWIIEKKTLGIEHWIAAVFVSISIYLHSSYPLKKKEKTV